ncbi:MAG: NEL-type E3 ubiquitin ligase domain-containing protein, partial [Candidatus Rhabdochlamydia sp.]
LSNCTALTTLPDDLKVKNHLKLSQCKKLKVLPTGLKVPGNLDLSDCTSLTSLGEGLIVQESLYLYGCTALTALPKRLKIKKSIEMRDCTNLTFLPEGLELQGNLNISKCIALTTLPKGLKIKYDLNASNCTSLTVIPEGLSIKNNIDFLGCTQLRELPNQLELGGDLNLRGCNNLSSLPNWILNLGPHSNKRTRSIDLTETGLSPAIIQRLQQESLSAQGMQFHFSLAAEKEHLIEFKTLLKSLEFWQQEAKETLVDLKKIDKQLHQNLPKAQDHQNLLTFLIRLTGTADFYNTATRELLAKRVLKMIQLIAENIEVCHHTAYLIHQGLSSCDDRITATLSDIGLYQKLKELQHPLVTAEELKNAAKGFFLLEQLNQKIVEQIKTLRFVDEVEIYMAFHMKLQKALNLPVDIQNMLFRRCVAISNEEIDLIGKELLETFSDEAFNSFLTSWDPWNLYQRRISVLDWENLPRANKRLFSTDICPYLQDVPTHPVLYNQVIYDYDAFIKRYIQEGVDLYGIKVQIKNLFRIESFLIESSTSEVLEE